MGGGAVMSAVRPLNFPEAAINLRLAESADNHMYFPLSSM